ncbi:hypothetical protein FACS189462_5280 [Spirochaetia bacterium]|nr:hypothetical protein FACS189462_5280 [Spirochaetia bacterium]
MKRKEAWIKTRISNDMGDKIKAYCLENHIKNNSVFFRFAIAKTLQFEIEDKDLVFESLQQLHGKIQKVLESEEIIYKHSRHFVKNWFAYHPEIDRENIESAAISAKQRDDKYFAGFKKSLQYSLPMFESIASDLVEEK